MNGGVPRLRPKALMGKMLSEVLEDFLPQLPKGHWLYVKLSKEFMPDYNPENIYQVTTSLGPVRLVVDEGQTENFTICIFEKEGEPDGDSN